MEAAAAWAALALVAATPMRAQTNDKSADASVDEVYVLSPFEVSASQDVGYMATSSLAGTRINSSLRDLGAAISVVTSEFIRDTAATNMEDLLVNTTDTEVGGASGNFTNSTNDVGRANQETNRANPESNTRVRGLVSADVTRDLFLTDFGFDTYNVERVDISRGPNSVLFGVGSPGGVINYSTKQARVDRNSGSIGLRFDQRGSVRTTGDFNEAIIPDRLAIRINGLSETTKYQQKPAYADDDRIALALTAVVFKGTKNGLIGSTTVRSNYEYAKVKTTPPNVIAPIDAIRDWYMVPDVAAITGQTGTTAPSRYTDGSFQPQAMHDVFGTNAPYMGSLAVRLPWFAAVGEVFTDPTDGNGPNIGFTDPALSNLGGIMGRFKGTFDWEMQSSLADESWTTGFTANTLHDTKIYDWVNTLITGRMDSRIDHFRNVTASLQQLFWNDNLGIEFAYNKQQLDRRNQFQFGVGNDYGIIDGRALDIKVDNNLWLGNGELNPNAGRPLLVSRIFGNHTELDKDRSTKRATSFLNLDFGDLIGGWGHWLGRHVFTGVAEEATYYQQTRGYAMAVSSDEVDMQKVLSANYNNFSRQLQAAFYVGPDLRSAPTYGDVHFSGYVDVPTPQNGDHFQTVIYDPATKSIRTIDTYAEEFLKRGSARYRDIRTAAATWQGYLLDGNLVGMFGWRKDHVKDTLSKSLPRLSNGMENPDNLVLQDTPDLDVSGETTSWSVVAHYPRNWLPALPVGSDFSLFYSDSENFTPVGFRQDVFLRSLPPPEGKTHEYGFIYSVLDRKIQLRINWYKTENTNVALDTTLARLAMSPIAQEEGRLLDAQNHDVPFGYDYAGNPTGALQYYSSYAELEQALIDIVPEPLKSAADPQIVPNSTGGYSFTTKSVEGLASSSDLVAQGMEIELVANPTKQWSIILNAAKQETIRTGSGSELVEYYGILRQGLVDAHLWDENIVDSPYTPTDQTTYKSRFTADRLNPLAAIAAMDGTKSAEQRKWRFNMTTSYRFEKGSPLNGFTVGGSVRWQDKAAVGYPINLIESEGDIIQQPDVAHPWYAPAQFNGDLFVRYTRKLSRRLRWSVQLNARNVIGDHDLVVSQINPDGSPAVYRVPVERTYILSTSLDF